MNRREGRRGSRRLAPIGAGMAALAAALLLALPGTGLGVYGSADAGPNPGPNPCQGAGASELLCPDLQAAPPREMYVTRTTDGIVRLRATNDIRSRGDGPLEVRGKRISRRVMNVHQMIHRADSGKKLSVKSNGRLYFYDVPGQGGYWKFKNALRFELWSTAKNGKAETMVRRGPKVYYCLRDLIHTFPSANSPRNAVYPGCSQNPKQKRRTLGTSVGWSDVYPSSYDRQYINITSLRGCFVFIHRVDPLDHLYETDETNNVGKMKIQLPVRKDGIINSC